MFSKHRRGLSNALNLSALAPPDHYYHPDNPKTNLTKYRLYLMADMSLTNKHEMNPFKKSPKPLKHNDTIAEDDLLDDDELTAVRQRLAKTKLGGRRPSIIPMGGEVPTTAIGSPGAPGGPGSPGKSSDEDEPLLMLAYGNEHQFRFRRGSIDQTRNKPRKFYIPNIDATLKELLENEDTDHNYQITIEDSGPKVLQLGTLNSQGYQKATIYGTYMLLNLLQELTIAKRFGRKEMILDEERLNENPVKRLQRLIQTQFWKSLTRQINKDNLLEMLADTKFKETFVDDNGVEHKDEASHRVYVPYNREDQYNYFMAIKHAHPEWPLAVEYLPQNIDAEFIKSINHRPGLLALLMYPDPEDPQNLVSQPYVVPGGRFNELYGWDSYMETLGLLTDVTPERQNHLRLARGMAENFIYEIYHYGKILNANRLYYLGRSQPPFLTDMALRIFNKTVEVAPERLEDTMDFLKRATLAAIREYHTVWVCAPRLDEELGLSCYHPTGLGVPPETEATHFDLVLSPYVKKYGLSQPDFIQKYNDGEIQEPDLDVYFLHDRAVRELGHDTLYRLEGKCAWLATVDLNSLLYKYETDIAFIVSHFFDDALDYEGEAQSQAPWLARAAARRQRMTEFMWNEEDGIFYDYHIKEKHQTGYELATTFWPMYALLATDEQAEALVGKSLKKFEEFGGLAAGTLRSRGQITLDRPSRQWDYPYGWAPQQMLAWIGLINYGYDGVARRLAYRWLFMMTKAFVDYNGVVVEKYNVIGALAPHKVDAEYGNQGLDFKGVATEGFGWVNASYVFGLTLLNLHAKRALGTLTPPPTFFHNLHPEQRVYFE